MNYISPQNRDTRYPLWYDRYDCRIPYIQTLDLEDLAEDGLPTSGDKHHDHAMQWEPRLVSLPIHRMAELWNSGANISLVKRDDAVKIYKAISAHLFAWKEHIEDNFNPVSPPHDDLLCLDNFANTVYEHAKIAFDHSFIQKHFKISSSTAIGRRAMLNAMTKTDEKRRINKEKGILELRNIEYYESIPKYNPNTTTAFIDYSGTDSKVDAPQRNSLSSFFKKGRK